MRLVLALNNGEKSPILKLTIFRVCGSILRDSRTRDPTHYNCDFL